MKNRLFQFLVILIFLSPAAASSQRVSSILTEDWTDSGWNGIYLTTNTYDVHGFLTGTIYQSENPGGWTDVSRETCINDDDGAAVQKVFQLWDQQTEDWQNSLRYSYTYNSSGKELSETMEEWSEENWINYQKKIKTYDVSGNLQDEVHQTWNTEDSTWVSITLNNYIFDDELLTMEIVQVWDSLTASWMNVERSVMTYNDSDQVSVIALEDWGGEWYDDRKEFYTYDQNNFLLQTLIKEWDVINQQWIDLARNNYFNNPDGSEYRVVSQTAVPMSNTWANELRLTYSYADPTLSVNAPSFEKASGIFPNPTSGKITLLNDLKVNSCVYLLSDNTGRIIRAVEFSGQQKSADVSDLGQGTYFLTEPLSGTSFIFFKVD